MLINKVFFLSRKSSFKMLYDLSNKVMVFGRYFILTMAGIKRLLVHLLIDRKEQWSRGNMGGNRTCNYKRASESDLWNLDVLMFSTDECKMKSRISLYRFYRSCPKMRYFMSSPQWGLVSRDLITLPLSLLLVFKAACLSLNS